MTFSYNTSFITCRMLRICHVSILPFTEFIWSLPNFVISSPLVLRLSPMAFNIWPLLAVQHHGQLYTPRLITPQDNGHWNLRIYWTLKSGTCIKSGKFATGKSFCKMFQLLIISNYSVISAPILNYQHIVYIVISFNVRHLHSQMRNAIKYWSIWDNL